MEYVSAALSQMGATFPTAVSMVAGYRPQWESDQLLRDATRTLVRTEIMLGTCSQGGAYHDHRADWLPRRSVIYTSRWEFGEGLVRTTGRSVGPEAFADSSSEKDWRRLNADHHRGLVRLRLYHGVPRPVSGRY